jgi:hypothetical protein
LRRLLLIAVALLSLSLPAAAQAAGASTTTPASALEGSTSPFAVGVPEPSATQTATTPTPTVATTPTSTSTDGSFSTLDAVLIAGGVALLIVAISFYVWWDARKAARHLRRGKPGASAAGIKGAGTKSAPRSRKLSAQEKKRRKRGKAQPRRR